MKDDLFSHHDALEQIDQRGDKWKQLAELIDFEQFREILEACWRKPSKLVPGGRPPWDAVLMFKILLVGLKTGKSDEQLEFLMQDSRTVERFLGLTEGDKVPDRTTIARYRSTLDTHAVRDVFEQFNACLAAAGYVAKDGQMVDSSFVLVPIQRNTRDENKTIKDDEVPATWQEDEATAKLRQKDTDARWTKKNGKSIYGYKNHICVDVKHKLVQGYAVTSAKVHDSVVAEDLVDPTQPGEGMYADAAYRSSDFDQALRQQGIKSRVIFKRQKEQELTRYQTRENKKRSKVRARVEHVFGSMQNELGGKAIRTIGMPRATIQIGLKNLLYNMHRFTYLAGANAC